MSHVVVKAVVNDLIIFFVLSKVIPIIYVLVSLLYVGLISNLISLLSLSTTILIFSPLEDDIIFVISVDELQFDHLQI